MQLATIPEQLDVLQTLETDDIDAIAELIGVPKKQAKFVKTMFKDNDEPKLLTGVVIDDSLKERVLKLQIPFRIVRINLEHQIAMEFPMSHDVDAAYGAVMDELMARKQALSSFPVEWYDFERNVFRVVLGVLHD